MLRACNFAGVEKDCAIMQTHQEETRWARVGLSFLTYLQIQLWCISGQQHTSARQASTDCTILGAPESVPQLPPLKAHAEGAVCSLLATPYLWLGAAQIHQA